jgi:membrane protease YdiL (CAAX protease family)
MAASHGSSPEPIAVAWYWRLLAFTAAFLAFTMLGRAVRYVLTGKARLPPGTDASAEPYFLLYRGTGSAAVLAATWLALRLLDRRQLRDVGLGEGLRDAALASTRGAGLAAAIFLAGFASLLATKHASVVNAGAPWQTIALHAVPATALVAIYEELLFRGYPFQIVAQRVGARPTILMFAALFGVVHYPNPGVTILGAGATALWSVLLGVLLGRTRSLWTCIGFHFAGNFVQSIVLGSRASGMSFGASVLTVEYAPTAFAGFPSGLEAAVPTLMAAAVALVVVARRPGWTPAAHARALFEDLVVRSP